MGGFSLSRECRRRCLLAASALAVAFGAHYILRDATDEDKGREIDLSEEEATAILKEMGAVDFFLLTDLSLIAAPMIQTGMTSEEMRDSILSPSVRANLLGKEKAILDSHGIYDSQAFVRCCQRLASKSPAFLLLMSDLEKMLEDTCMGRLPCLPGYTSQPEVTADEMLEILTKIARAQRTETVEQMRTLALQIEDVEWLPKHGVDLSDESALRFEPPEAGVTALRYAMRQAEHRVVEENAAVVGSRHNFMQNFALLSREPEFKQQWLLIQQLSQSQLIEQLAALRAELTALFAAEKEDSPPENAAAVCSPVDEKDEYKTGEI